MTNWRPSASIERLKIRAKILKSIRDFFDARGVMEVETPLLCHTSVTDPHIESIPAFFSNRQKKECYYLQTSPEYAMKRLLSAGYGSIYQITKAFRQGEQGRFHNPEFTLLEWYRIGFDHHDLMDEVDQLLQGILNVPQAERKTYAQVFDAFLKLNPHEASFHELKQSAKENNINVCELKDKNAWLELLMSHVIEPHLGKNRPCFIYDFPASQAALARTNPIFSPSTASRFEVYVRGIELANGFHELKDAKEQRQRFEKNLMERRQLGLPELALDERFLVALSHGLPDCSGVALGIDRLIMLATESDSIEEVLSFDFNRV